MRISLILDCSDPEVLASFWCAALGYERVWGNETYVALADPQKQRPVLSLQRVAEPKTTKNRMHIDIHAPDLEEGVERMRALGATQISDDPTKLGDIAWIVMQDPEGNEFCVVSP